MKAEKTNHEKLSRRRHTMSYAVMVQLHPRAGSHTWSKSERSKIERRGGAPFVHQLRQRSPESLIDRVQVPRLQLFVWGRPSCKGVSAVTTRAAGRRRARVVACCHSEHVVHVEYAVARRQTAQPPRLHGRHPCPARRRALGPQAASGPRGRRRRAAPAFWALTYIALERTRSMAGTVVHRHGAQPMHAACLGRAPA